MSPDDEAVPGVAASQIEIDLKKTFHVPDAKSLLKSALEDCEFCRRARKLKKPRRRALQSIIVARWCAFELHDVLISVLQRCQIDLTELFERNQSGHARPEGEDEAYPVQHKRDEPSLFMISAVHRLHT